jgi:hypothetical protein
MFDSFTVRATTSVTGSRLSNWEMSNGMDRHELSNVKSAIAAFDTNRKITNFKATTLGNILRSDKLISFDMLARNVIDEKIFDRNAQCEVGSSGKYRVLKIEGKRFLQIGTTYFGEVESD